MTNFQDDNILYLSRKDVEMACKEIDSVAVMREVFKLHGSGQTMLPDEAYLGWVNAQGEQVRNLNMPGYVGGSLRVAGTKIINANISNPTRGLPRASGVTMLYDNSSVRVLCIMEGAYLSSLRTASVSVLAADVLKGEDIQSVAIIGAGVLAKAHIDVLVKSLPRLLYIRVFDLAEERITQLQREAAPVLQAHNVILYATSTAEEAIRAAQVVVPVTTTTVGYIRFEWLQPGAILINVSLDDPLPEVVFKADTVIVDDWNLVKNDTRRLLGRMYRAEQIIGPDEPVGVIHKGRRRIDAQLGEIVLGTKTGRSSVNDIILVNPFGLAIEDVALAAHVYRAARNLGLGMLLER
jgi:ornithine cyclodeaminase/alanine dehydrogenase-like protein (mu-crystallin family)